MTNNELKLNRIKTIRTAAIEASSALKLSGLDIWSWGKTLKASRADRFTAELTAKVDQVERMLNGHAASDLPSSVRSKIITIIGLYRSSAFEVRTKAAYMNNADVAVTIRGELIEALNSILKAARDMAKADADVSEQAKVSATVEVLKQAWAAAGDACDTARTKAYAAQGLDAVLKAHAEYEVARAAEYAAYCEYQKVLTS